MKLFLSTKLQKELGYKCEKVPTPEDLLDRWYANLIELNGADTVVAILPDFRFCVILWDIPLGPSTDLTKLLVPAIRKALQDPYYGIPLSAIDQYMPEDTRFEPCATGDRSFTSRMGAATMLVLNDQTCRFASLDAFDPLQTQRIVNGGYLDRPGQETCTRWEAVKEQLQLQYGGNAAALELEISLDLRQYVMRRTLLVSEDISFGTLHLYLKKACFYPADSLPRLVLRRMEKNWDDTRHAFKPLDGQNGSSKGKSWKDEDRLSDRVRAGDMFRYCYAPAGAKHQWELVIRVRHRLTTEEKLPVCTLCEGQEPPDCVDGVEGYQAFRKVLEDPEDPRYEEYARAVGVGWFFPARPESVTKGLRLIGIFP